MRSFSFYVNAYRIIDGDTLQATLDIGFHLSWDFNVRLNGLDCPEAHGATAKYSDLAAKVVLRWMNQGGDLKIQSLSTEEKYGRLLGIIWDENNCSLNDFLLRNELAQPYDGKTKTPWTLAALLILEKSANALLSSGQWTR